MSKRVLSQLGLITFAIVLIATFQFLPQVQSFAQPGCQTFKETAKTVCGKFLQYWQQNGGVRQQGFPISNEFTEISDLNGKPYTVQYFERAVFEYHPENQPPNDILLSQLGTFQFRKKYLGNEPGAPTPTVTPPPSLGVKIDLPPIEGLTIKLESAPRFETCNNGNSLRWPLYVSNNGKLPANVFLDKGNISMSDSTGKTYGLATNLNCAGGPFGYGSFSNDVVKPGGVLVNPPFGGGSIFILMEANDVPVTATYFDIRLGNINGISVTFRYSLK
jgi:hypothetical protein